MVRAEKQELLLLKCFKRGLIPGPNETEEFFFQRITKAHDLYAVSWKEASRKTSELFGFEVDWAPLKYGNDNLAWWEGAVTWLEPGALPLVQLRTRFKEGSFLGYQPADILAHEAIHVSRMNFNESHFEEILAYSTSTSSWKRFLGPLFTNSYQIICCLVACLLGFFSPFLCFFPLICLFTWLALRQITFKKCQKKVSNLVLLCLTDKEIWDLGWKKSIEELYTSSLRHQLIRCLISSKGEYPKEF